MRISSHCALLFVSPQGLWDLSGRGDFQHRSPNPVAVEQRYGFVQPLPTPSLPAEALSVLSPPHSASDVSTALLRLIERWRNEAVRAGRPIRRIALAYEAGRDGFWLARWLIARGIEAHVIHSASVAVSNSAHGALHRAGTGQVQELLAIGLRRPSAT